MNILRRSLIWISRIGYCRGFHVQSPTDYRFICEVINERSLYYLYTDLQKERLIFDKVELKLCRLYFRISNFVQPGVCLAFTSVNSNSSAYILAGCNKVRIFSVSDTQHIDISQLIRLFKSIDMVHVTMSHHHISCIYQLMDYVNDHTVFIIDDIQKDNATRRMWNQLLLDKRVRISFDLYYCGIIFFDSNRYKQNYIVNF